MNFKIMIPYIQEALKHDMAVLEKNGISSEEAQRRFDILEKRIEENDLTDDLVKGIERIVTSHHDRCPQTAIDLNVIVHVLEIINEFRGRDTIDDYISDLNGLVHPQIVCIMFASLDIFEEEYPGIINVNMLRALGIEDFAISAFLTNAYFKGRITREVDKETDTAAFYTK